MSTMKFALTVILYCSLIMIKKLFQLIKNFYSKIKEKIINDLFYINNLLKELNKFLCIDFFYFFYIYLYIYNNQC